MAAGEEEEDGKFASVDHIPLNERGGVGKIMIQSECFNCLDQNWQSFNNVLGICCVLRGPGERMHDRMWVC